MDNRPTYIYALCEPDGQTVRYVGKTVNLYKRYMSHLHPNRTKRRTHKMNWIASLHDRGERPIMLELECVSPDADWAERERYWIAYYRQLGFDLTNHSDGGEGACGVVLSEETRRKIGDAHRGKTVSDETRLKISCANSGRKHTPESRQHMGDSHRGKKRSPEAIAKTAEAHRGMKRSDETREKLRERSTGRKHNTDTRQKMSDSRRGMKRQPESVEKTATAHRGRKRSDETREKQRKSWENRERREHNTPESNAKRSESMQRYWERKRAESTQSA